MLQPSGNRIPALLLLSDGTAFEGYAVGKPGKTFGEICFNTGMTGYQEIFSDPSYFGQILVATHTHIGNYGVHKDESESQQLQISGMVCRNFSETYSRFGATSSLLKAFENQGMVAMEGIDTRALVRYIREKGAMNAVIASTGESKESLLQELATWPEMAGLELSSRVSTTEPYFFGNANAPYKVAALDFGIKKSILQSLANRGCYVKVFPWDASFEDLNTFDPHGYFLSNGPGDPAVMHSVVKVVQDILTTHKPLFGICLGHQLLCLACGISTHKMFTGHRGINHPVKNLETGLSEITSQNHGFAVDTSAGDANSPVQVTHINLNDKSIEGVRVKNKKAFSVQYHPEASPGPHDSRYLFDQFVGMME